MRVPGPASPSPSPLRVCRRVGLRAAVDACAAVRACVCLAATTRTASRAGAGDRTDYLANQIGA